MAWYNTTLTTGQDGAIACHSHLIQQCGLTKATKAKEPKRCPNTGTRSIKEHSIMHRLLEQVVLAYRDCSKVFESYTDAPSKQLGAVYTQDNC